MMDYSLPKSHQRRYTFFPYPDHSCVVSGKVTVVARSYEIAHARACKELDRLASKAGYELAAGPWELVLDKVEK